MFAFRDAACCWRLCHGWANFVDAVVDFENVERRDGSWTGILSPANAPPPFPPRLFGRETGSLSPGGLFPAVGTVS